MNSLIIFYIDRSGSMQGNMDGTISGLNEFIRINQMRQDDCDLYIATFGEKMLVSHEFVPIFEVAPISYNASKFKPHGGTAGWKHLPILFDNIVNEINSLPEAERPPSVTFIMQSDGGDNLLSIHRSMVQTYGENVSEIPEHKLKADQFFAPHEGRAVIKAIKTVEAMHNLGWRTIFLACNNDRHAIESAEALKFQHVIPYNAMRTKNVYGELGKAVIESMVTGDALNLGQFTKT